jgi:hypothetical protein
MMDTISPGKSLFHYFRIDDQVVENHLLRPIDRRVNFEFVRAKLKGLPQRCGKAIDRPKATVSHTAGQLSLRGDERRETGGRATHAFGAALVHRTRL